MLLVVAVSDLALEVDHEMRFILDRSDFDAAELGSLHCCEVVLLLDNQIVNDFILLCKFAFDEEEASLKLCVLLLEHIRGHPLFHDIVV